MIRLSRASNHQIIPYMIIIAAKMLMQGPIQLLLGLRQGGNKFMGHDKLRDMWLPFRLERGPSWWVSRILQFQSMTFQLILDVFLCGLIQQISITRNGRPEDVLGCGDLLQVNLINQADGLWIPFNIVTSGILPRASLRTLVTPFAHL